jgi:hypothetical protein
MGRRSVRTITKVGAALAAGLLFASLTCVENVADFAGTGLTLTGATGLLGTNGSQAATDLGVGLDFAADVMQVAQLRR